TLWKVRVVVAARDFQTRQFQFLRLQSDIAIGALPLKFANHDRLDTLNPLRRRVERTEKQRPAESKIVGMKNAEASVGQSATAEISQQRLFPPVAKIMGFAAALHLVLERDVNRPIHVEVLPRHAIRFEFVFDLLLERVVNFCSAEAVYRDEHRSPTAGPAEG